MHALLHDGGIALIAGIIAALLSYFFGRIVLKPRLGYSRTIRLRTFEEDDGKASEITQFKLLNESYWRTVTHLEISAIVLVPHENKSNSASHRDLLRVPLTLSAEHALRLAPRQTRVTAIDPTRLRSFTELRLRQLGASDLVDNTDRTLRELLELHLLPDTFDLRDKLNQARMRIVIGCKDAITGRDFSFEYGPYYADDIKTGRFFGTNDDTEFQQILAKQVTKRISAITHALTERQQLGFIPEE